MRKLELRMDDLRVETFATTAEEAAVRGTVRGWQATEECLTPPCPASVNPCVTHDIVCLSRAHCPTRGC